MSEGIKQLHDFVIDELSKENEELSRVFEEKYLKFKNSNNSFWELIDEYKKELDQESIKIKESQVKQLFSITLTNLDSIVKLLKNNSKS